VRVLPAAPSELWVENCELRIQEFLRAVLMDDTAIATSSLASAKIAFESAGPIFPASWSNSIQNADSSASSETIPSFAMKSSFDLARQAAR